MQKKNEDIDGIKLLVFMTEIAIKIPTRQAPPSPKNIFARGKLNIIKIKIIKLILKRIYEKL